MRHSAMSPAQSRASARAALAMGNGIPAAAAAALTSGVLACLADYPHPLPALAWIAPVPVLVAALRRPARDALWLGVLWGAPLLTVFAAGVQADFLPPAAVAGLYAGALLWKALELALTVRAARGLPGWLAGWVFAAAVVLGEWSLEAAGMPLWWNTATLQIESAWLRPVAAIGGPYLLSFLVALVGGTAAVLLQAPRRQAFAAGAAAAIALSVAVLAGHLAVPAVDRSLRVAAVVAPPRADAAARWDRGVVDRAEVDEMLADYDRLTQRAARAGARLIVWPEYALSARGDGIAAVRATVMALARATDATIVAGYIDLDAAENRAILVEGAAAPRVYTKQHLVPGFETSRFSAGHEPYGAARVDGIGTAAMICYDAAYTSAARLAARAGLDVLVVPARHWDGIEDVYPSWAAFRSAENGIAMVQAVRDGRSMLVDPTGRVLASESSLGGREVVLVGDLPVARAGTPYSHLGNWPVLLAIALLTTGVVRSMRP